MEIKPVTKDTYKVMSAIYGSYLERINSLNMTKESASTFEASDQKAIYQGWMHEKDFDSAVSELEKIGFLGKDIIGGFTICDNLIVYMEGKLKRGLNDVKDILSGVVDVLTLFA